MSGASSRRRGHRWEVKVANELSDRFGLDLRTGRFFGLTYGADVVTVTGYDGNGRPATFVPDVLGWSIEAKADKSRSIAQWIRQAVNQAAPDTTPVVLWRRDNHGFEKGSAFLVDREAKRGWREVTIGQWLESATA